MSCGGCFVSTTPDVRNSDGRVCLNSKDQGVNVEFQAQEYGFEGLIFLYFFLRLLKQLCLDEREDQLRACIAGGRSALGSCIHPPSTTISRMPFSPPSMCVLILRVIQLRQTLVGVSVCRSSEQNIKLREEVRRLQATLASKEAAVERYKSQLDDQTLLVQSLHAERTASGEQSGYTGSLMNEIELMMMTQIGDDSGNGGGEAEAEGGIDAVGGEPPSPAKAAPQLSSGGEDSANAGSPFPNTSATPTKAERVPSEPAENMPTSQPSSPSRQQKGHAYILQDRLQVYAAASANHLSGRKVITPQMAAEMDIPSLQKTAAALQDLIDTRSSRLINALEERSWLDNDIQMKNGIVRLLVQRAAADASPRTSSSKATPSPRQRSSDGPASTPRRTNSGAGRSSLGGAMSAFGSSIISTPKAMASRLKFWGSSTPARPSSPSSTASAGGTPPKMGKTGSPTPKDEAPG